MIAKSTAIVRGKAGQSWAAFTGPVIYTHYQVQVSESFKGASAAAATLDVVVPGGVAGNLRQSFAGAPVLNSGEEYVFLLWTGRNGLTQVIGLTQGLFALDKRQADPMATRAATRELMLDPRNGKPVSDQTLVMRLSELRTRISSTLANNKAQVK
jgi:hypothetical protein